MAGPWPSIAPLSSILQCRKNEKEWQIPGNGPKDAQVQIPSLPWSSWVAVGTTTSLDAEPLFQIFVVEDEVEQTRSQLQTCPACCRPDLNRAVIHKRVLGSDRKGKIRSVSH